MKAAMLENNIVANIITVDNENFKQLKTKGFSLLAAESLGLEIGDYTENGTMFYRDVPIYDPETGEQTGTEKKSLPLDDYEYADMKAALQTLGYSEKEAAEYGEV